MKAWEEMARERVWAVHKDGFRHYVRTSSPLGTSGPALCGAMPDTGNRKWFPLRILTERPVCQTCHAIASRELARIVTRA